MTENRETQHAEVAVRVAKSFDVAIPKGDRKIDIADLIEQALEESEHLEFRSTSEYEVDLGHTETPEETAERRMAEAEGEALAEAEARAERFYEERAGRHLW